VTSGSFRGSGTSQSMQRNLRPPVLTSMKRIGLLHFGHVGGGVFLAIGRSPSQAGAQHSQSPVHAEGGAVIGLCTPAIWPGTDVKV
jgi:hypothetical protein